LPPRLKELISMAYCAFANEITGRLWFPKIPTIKEILEEITLILILKGVSDEQSRKEKFKKSIRGK